jgi:hypothetical protein
MRDLGYVLVTDRRLLWTEGRRLLSLPFELILRAQEIFEETHRYRLRLLHEPIERERDPAFPWDLPQHVRRFRQRHRWNRLTDLPFSRANTAAAVAIRRALDRTKVPLLPHVVRPHRRDQQVRYLVRVSPLRSWWHRRRLPGRT